MSQSSSTTIIGVAGGSASGKSTLVRKLQEAFVEEHVTTLCHDFYYKAHDELTLEERSKLNYDHPHSFDTDMMIEHIRLLKQGQSVQRPVYSFNEHNRLSQTVLVHPAKQYFSTVKPMHRDFVEPSKRYADIIIPEGGMNPVALSLLVENIHSLLR